MTSQHQRISCISQASAESCLLSAASSFTLWPLECVAAADASACLRGLPEKVLWSFEESQTSFWMDTIYIIALSQT